MTHGYARRRARLRNIAEALLSEDVSVDLAEKATDLYDLFAAISAAEPLGETDTLLPNGRALSPASAAACTRDGMRTAVFLRGARDAIAEARARFAGERIEVVYAGTGPFAPLAIPLMPFLSPSEVRFTLIDLHDQSVRSVQSIVRHFGFGAWVRSARAGDATRYRHPRGVAVHVVIAEAMQRALGIEPQVEILGSLSKQLAENGIMVPECVSVELVLADPEFAVQRPASNGHAVACRRVGEVVALGGSTLKRPVDGSNRLAERTLTIPAVPERASAIYVTTIRAYGRHVLREFESGLTCPEVVWDLTNLREGERIAFWYELGVRPGIRWERSKAISPPA